MAVVALKDLGMPMTNDGYRYYDEITFSGGVGVPPRPHPQPPDPPLGIWGPGDPRPTLPIAGWDPIHGTFPPGVITPPGTPALGGTIAIIRRVPEGVTPPAESSPQAAWVQVVMEKGSPPTFAKLEPYASTGPVEPPTTTKK